MHKEKHYELVLATSLTADGDTEFDLFRHANQGGDTAMTGAGTANLIDKFEYVMHGKIFEDKVEGQQLTVFISFGGLLMSVKGESKDLNSLEMDSRIYLCLKLIP